MKTKILTIFILLTTTAVFAQQNQVDTIYLRNGTIVQGSVIEPDVQIKIKSTDGGTFVFPINDIEKIIIDNNTVVFSTNIVEKIVEDSNMVVLPTNRAEKITKEEPVVKQNTIITSTIQKKEVDLGVFRNAFGWELGFGTIGAVRQFNNVPSYNMGMHYLHHFSSYFGADFVKVNLRMGQKNGFVKQTPNIHSFEIDRYIPEHITYNDYLVYCLQVMTGLRGNTPAFKCMSGYGAFRLGYGESFGDVNYADSNPPHAKDELYLDGSGFCFELELGVNLTRNISVGYVYNYQYNSELPISSNMLRLNLNIGK